MADAMDDLKPVSKKWIATKAGFVKSSHLWAKDLPESEKIAVPAGASLVARQTGRHGEFILIADAVLDGQPLPPRMTFIHQEHWQLALPAKPNDSAGTTLTERRLIGSRWRFGKLDDAPLTTAFYFTLNGRISGHRSPHEQFWTLEQNEVRIFNDAGRLSWIFTVSAETDGRLTLIGTPQSALYGDYFSLTEMPAGASALTPVTAVAEGGADVAEGKKDDIIKMVIWDLDDTFWNGTLAEGGITPIEANIDLVKTLSARGIVNSICSKNEFERTKQQLITLGIWDYFIFPRIDFAPKGAMIQDIIQSAQLRAPSVLFIDDNPVNINEALHYNAGLQTCLPDVIASLLDDPRCKGKPDPALTRLKRYKVLEKKSADKASVGSDNLDFLRGSEIRISFHHEIGDEFPRIHDLVNRTNQLNFTKKRWPEDEQEARAVFLEEQALNQNFDSHWGYVKVADKYGSYGICGFYLVRPGGAYHFLFSCRSLNMGIEQFVWQKIGRPKIKIVGEVVSNLGDQPDWITVVDDADALPDGAIAANQTTICVRGACDLSMMNHYLRTRYETSEEFAFPYQQWEIHPAARAVVVFDETTTPAGKALIEKMPGMPPRRFISAINSGESDVYVLSFSSEVFVGLYESKSTGMILPLNYSPFPRQGFKKIEYAKLVEKNPNCLMSEADWRFLQDEFTLLGVLDQKQLAADVDAIFRKLQGKLVIVLTLSTKVGSNKWILGEFAKINAVVGPLVSKYQYHSIDLGEFVKDITDLVGPKDFGVHFNRNVYQQVADRVSEIIQANIPAASVKRLSVS